MKIFSFIVLVALVFVGCSDDKQGYVSKAQSEQDLASKQTEKKVEAKVAEVKVKVPVEEVVPKEVVVKEEPRAVVAVITGDSIYRACSACHGLNGEKVALGKSQIIQGWSADKVADALNGYKDGTYGGVMKAIMKGQVTALSADEIKLVSEYISKL
jgi:cytochrome c553